ncbi:MAG: UMP kinase, partial [Patescibacteria group bacterium]
SLRQVSRQIAAVNKKGVAIAVVIGGGNIWRFRDNKQISSLPRVESDYLGMSATIFNAVTLASALRKLKIRTKVFSAIRAPVELAEPYSASAAKKFLDKGGVAILAGGTGKPFVTTDSAAAMRAGELNCEAVLKATNVNGVYSADPRKSKSAKLLKEIDYATAIRQKLGVMDQKAFRILAKHKIPTFVFNFNRKGLLGRAAAGQNAGTVINF